MSIGQVVALLLSGSVLGLVSTIIVTLLKNSRRSPEMRTAMDNGWAQLTGGLQTRLANLEASDVAKEAKIAEQAQRVSDLESTLAHLRSTLEDLRLLNAWLTRRVEQLVAFIVHHQMEPPAEEPRPDDAQPKL